MLPLLRLVEHFQRLLHFPSQVILQFRLMAQLQLVLQVRRRRLRHLLALERFQPQLQAQLLMVHLQLVQLQLEHLQLEHLRPVLPRLVFLLWDRRQYIRNHFTLDPIFENVEIRFRFRVLNCALWTNEKNVFQPFSSYYDVSFKFVHLQRSLEPVLVLVVVVVVNSSLQMVPQHLLVASPI